MPSTSRLWNAVDVVGHSRILGSYPLSDLIYGKRHALAKKRTRLVAGRISPQKVSQDSHHEAAFQRYKKVLAHQGTLAYIDPKKRLCIYIDASDYFWWGVVTQIPHSDGSLPCIDQRHKPLAFLLGQFQDSSLQWSTIEREAYKLFASTERIRWLLASKQSFDLYKGHSDLTFLLHTVSLVNDPSQMTLQKSLRWAVRLSTYSYSCNHVEKSDDGWMIPSSAGNLCKCCVVLLESWPLHHQKQTLLNRQMPQVFMNCKKITAGKCSFNCNATMKVCSAIRMEPSESQTKTLTFIPDFERLHILDQVGIARPPRQPKYVVSTTQRPQQ